MRIAFLNPWKNAAENQAFRSLQIAAERVGHEFYIVVTVATSMPALLILSSLPPPHSPS